MVIRQVYTFNYFKPDDHLQDQHYNVCIRQEDDMCRLGCIMIKLIIMKTTKVMMTMTFSALAG